MSTESESAESAALRRQVEELTERVARLEERLGMGAPRPAADLARPARTAADETARAIAVAGKALLGIAGAYLLRALTESGTLSTDLGVSLGIVYAFLWLVWAAYIPAGRRIDTALHALTSVLLLAPLLWEAMFRFHALSTWTASLVLLFFTVFGLAVSWRKNLLIVATFATLGGLATTIALMLGTHDLAPFLAALLGIAAAVEAAACLDHWLSERWVAAAAADLAVLFATHLVVRFHGVPEGYAPLPLTWLLAALLALPAIYLLSTMLRTLVHGRTFTVFETAQWTIALAISIGGGWQLAGSPQISGTARIGLATGALALIAAGLCYLAAFALLARRPQETRNFQTYASFALVLALAGSIILLPDSSAAVTWAVLAAVCMWSARRFSVLILELQGLLYLLASAVVSGILVESAVALFGTAPQARQSGLAGAAGGIAALVCYGLTTWRVSDRDVTPARKTLRIGTAAIATWLSAGFLAALATSGYQWYFGVPATSPYCDSIRTGVLAISAVALAWAGSHSARAELSRLAYPLMILGAYRLLTQDMRQDVKTPLFLSLLLYGSALILLPRLSPRKAR
jgi:hypothetical protein